MDGSEKLVIACVTAPLLLHELQNLLNYELKVPVREAIDQLEMISTRLRDAEKILTILDIDYRTCEEFLEKLNHLEDVIIDGFLGGIKLRRRFESLKIMSPLIRFRPQVRIDLISEKLDSFTASAFKVFTKLECLGPTTGGTTGSPPQPMRTINLDYPMPDDSDFVGINDRVDEVVKKLLCYGERTYYTIGVTGEEGSGKTFFTRKVYNATDVKRHFQGRAWVNFSEYFEARESLLNILTQLTWWDWELLDENLSHGELVLKLERFSSMNRCLIVVDDVRTVEGFYRLYHECGLSIPWIWLILTSSKKELDSLKLKNRFCHSISLRKLTGEESWTLFCKKAQIAEEEEINLKKNILRNCGGSPREILIMEGLLSTTKWPSSVIEHSIQKDILNLCYQDLSSQMKVCFLYFGLFPSAFEIPVRRLFHLWVAERLFITLPERNIALEDLAEECLKLLIRRNLIEVTKVRLDGSPKTCRMPVTTWAVFSRKATALFSRESNKIRPPKDYLRPYASFNSRTPKSVNDFLDRLVAPSGFRLLVVLDLENVYKPVLLSETLGKLVLLKHLGLRRTFLDSLPRSVGNLPFLETLDVKHTNITTLPSSVWKAKNLQHLYLNENNFDMSFEKLYIIRSELQTLSGLFIGNKSVTWSNLYTLLRLRKLKLTFYSKFAEGIGEWISELKSLRSLKLRSIDEFDRPSTLEFGFLELQHKLLELYLVGPLTRSIESLNSPNLKVLTLSVSKLEMDPMPVLGKLRHLNCLRLFRNSYLGKVMKCSAEEFPQLRVLKLWMLENLEEWTVMEGTMPLLRELEIRLCPKLKLPEKLPLTLKDVVLINMPDGFVEHVERVLVNSFVKKITLPFAALLAEAKVSDELIARTAACVLAAAPMPDKD